VSAHDPYFTRMQSALQRHGDGTPTVVLDLGRVRRNADRLRSLWPKRHAVRLAVKSLPCMPLLESLAAQLETTRFMVFHPAHLAPVFDRFPAADVLFGKPVPLRAVSLALDALSPSQQRSVRWLADDVSRVEALADLARTRGVTLSVALEIDVGLHRGGLAEPGALRALRQHFQGQGPLRFAGLMGYDGHLGRIPWPLQRIPRSHANSMQRYRAVKDALAAEGFALDETVVFNGGGSLSFMEYRESDPTDDLTVGSCLVKPAHFEDARLAELEPAAWIASPVLKRVDRFVAPDGEWLAPLASAVKGLRGPGVYLFGGRFGGAPVSPADLVANLALGDSANQALYQLDRGAPLAVDDWAFFRPDESEATLDRFAYAHAVDEDDSVARWPTLRC
jgi:D-serine deaminase-like pyridoxal phosphate-dependent protein